MVNRLSFSALAMTVVLLSSVFSLQLIPSSHPYGLVNNSHSIGFTLYVGGDGPNNYSKIQAAIFEANNNDRIIVFPGLYLEHITVEKQVSIIGKSKEDTIIDGGFNGSVFSLMHDNISIQNLTIRNSGGNYSDSLLYIDSSAVKVTNCQFEYARNGIIIHNTELSMLVNNSFYHIATGIRITQSHDILIVQSTFIKNGIGVISNQSYRITFQRCYGDLNGVTFFIEYSHTVDISHCILSNNNENQVNIFSEYSTDIEIKNSVLYHSGFGIRIDNCSQSSLHGLLIYDSKMGVVLSSSADITVNNSQINNTDVGIYLQNSSNLRIYQNNIYNSYVTGLSSINSWCDATLNWWGAILGPFFNTYANSGQVRRMPWLSQPVSLAFNYTKLKMPSLPQKTNTYVPVFNETDSDSDGVPDWWEEKYNYNPEEWNNHTELDPDKDGLTNIEEFMTESYGSNPYQRDLFIEIDVMDKDYKLSDKKKMQLIERFQRQGITVHIDDNTEMEGEIIKKMKNVDYPTLQNIYWTYFLHENPCAWKKGVFHYVLLSESLFINMPGFVFIGWDQADSFSLNIQYYTQQFKSPVFEHILATVFMHELGHTLGLFHDVFPGIDNESGIIPFLKPFIQGWITYWNYRSCMNYMFAWQILDYSDGTHGKGDFDDWSNLNLLFFQDSKWGV